MGAKSDGGGSKKPRSKAGAKARSAAKKPDAKGAKTRASGSGPAAKRGKANRTASAPKASKRSTAKGKKAKLKGKSRKHPEPEVIEFGHRLKRLRDEVEKTQEQVALDAGLHWSYVGQIERGERNLTYLNILRLARGLGLPPGRLVDDDHEG